MIGNGIREDRRNEHSRFPGSSELMTDLQVGKIGRGIDSWLKGEKVNKLIFGYVEFKIPLGHPRGYVDSLKHVWSRVDS